MSNDFCPFIKDTCKSNCVFHTRKTLNEDGEKACILSLAARTMDTYCDLKIREMEGNLPTPHHKQ